MFKSIDLDKEFATKEEMFAEVKANKENIIAFKKSIVYKSIDKGQLSVNKALIVATKGIITKENFIYPVINTTNFLDSHLDLHQKGIWSRSSKDQQGKIRYSLDHSTKVADVIAYPKDVNIQVIDTTFKELGLDYTGDTQALVFEINKDVIDNAEALKVLNKQLPVENSVSMQYVKIELALNSEEKEYKAEKSLWDNRISSVANKEFAEEQGIMWIVTEAKIVNESSMVTQGSNSATPIIYGTSEAAKSTSKTIEPSKDTHSLANFIHLIN
jgi:hypothetical protein